MKLLLSNDDGVGSEGIRALALELCHDHDLYISAPDCERSAVSRSMTLFSPLRACPTKIKGLPDVLAYAVSGTPVDCVRLALGNLFPAPDMVISGINVGPNLGTDVLYSGTVAAAHEAALLGYQAIAVSACSFDPQHFDTAAKAARMGIAYLNKHPFPFGTVLNINVPDLPMEEICGVKVTRACVEQYTLKYIEREDPMGRPYYWVPRGRMTDVGQTDVDERWSSQGYVTITPLTYDLTDYRLMDKMDAEEFSMQQ
ncbi:MAG: 5'/3'-nucleotidase SurE [Clostridia bacterium]